MAERIDEAAVRHISHLARLNPTDEEVQLFSEQLSAILAYMDQLNELDTADVPPTAHALPPAGGDEGEADQLAGTIAALLAAVTLVLVAAGILLADPLVRVFTNWESDPDKFQLTVSLTRITTVGLGFLVLSAWCLGVLNSHRRFFLPYLAPAVWNTAIIAVLWWV
ncbi:MAG: hypothetical protein GY773_10740, partial [Actinomycetia bacterium]|nr:hypothetical protein [Actinomycetes bacterium]